MTDTSMEIELNGEIRRIGTGCSVAALLDELQLKNRRVAVEINQNIVPRSRHEDHKLKAGDRVEIIHAIGGG